MEAVVVLTPGEEEAASKGGGRHGGAAMDVEYERSPGCREKVGWLSAMSGVGMSSSSSLSISKQVIFAADLFTGRDL